MPVRAEILSKERSSLGYNCVKFARSKADFPLGLWTFQDKVNLIRTNEPTVGAVFVEETKLPYGHVGIVKEVKENTLIVEDANYISGYITVREISKNQIKGYL